MDWGDVMGNIGSGIATVLFDWGVLLEAVSIVVIVPLTAALVDRDRKRRLRSVRRMSAIHLFNECFTLCRFFMQAFITLGHLRNSPDSLLELGHKVLGESLDWSERDRLVLHLGDIDFHRANHHRILLDSESKFIEVQRSCARLLQDMNYFLEVMEPEEIIKLTSARQGIVQIEQSCHSWLMNIQREKQRQEKTNITMIDQELAIGLIVTFIEHFGAADSIEPWYVRAYDRVRGQNPVALTTFEKEERNDLVKALKGIREANLLVELSTQKEVLKALQDSRSLESYDKWTVETQQWLSKLQAKDDLRQAEP